MASPRRRRRPTRRPVTPGFRDYVLAQLEGLGEVVPRAMFGCVGLYHQGTFFGIVAGDVLYLKVDDSTRADYERAGTEPFRPYPNRSTVSMSYYPVPLDVLESSFDLSRWARKSVQAAHTRNRRARTRRGTRT